MKRRDFIAALGGAAALAFLGRLRARAGRGCAASACSLPQAADDPDSQARLAAFVQALQQLGWTDGRNVRIDTRWAAAIADDIRRYAAELVALAPDVILANGTRRGAGASGDSHRADRVRDRPRSGRRRLCR